MKNLSNEQSKRVRGGVGRDFGVRPGAGAGSNAWGFPTPFNPSENENAGLRKNFVPGTFVAGNSAIRVGPPVKQPSRS